MAEYGDSPTVHDQLPSVEEVRGIASEQRPSISRKENIVRSLVVLLVVAVVIGVSLPFAINARQATLEPESIILQAVLHQGIVTNAAEYEFPPRSIQGRSLYLVKNEVELSEEQTIQLYALWCFYFATEHVQTDLSDAVFGLGTVPRWFDGWTNDGPDACLFFGVRCNSNGIVTEIDVRNNGLSGALPQELTLLSSLRKLDLQDNTGLGQGGVPDWLKDLPSIELIDLRGCSYSGTIPDELCLEQKSGAFDLYVGCSDKLTCC